MICNTGVGLDPTVDGEAHHFAAQGLYDGLFLAVDRETGTSWNHITGRAVHGPLVGEELQVYPVLQTTVEQALEEDPATRIAISEREYRQGQPGFFERIRALSPFFQRTVGEEDERLPTMEIGLGVWTEAEGGTHRFYPQDDVLDAGPVVDTIDGRRVLVFYSEDRYAMAAQYTDAESARREGDAVVLSNGHRVLGSGTVDAEGDPVEVERPLQVYTRWYGFSLTFEEPEIWGRDR